VSPIVVNTNSIDVLELAQVVLSFISKAKEAVSGMVDIGHKDNIRERKATKRDRGEIHKRERDKQTKEIGTNKEEILKRAKDKQRRYPQAREGQTNKKRGKAVVCDVDHHPRYA
jgi:hypothetical protein